MPEQPEKSEELPEAVSGQNQLELSENMLGINNILLQNSYAQVSATGDLNFF